MTTEGNDMKKLLSQAKSEIQQLKNENSSQITEAQEKVKSGFLVIGQQLQGAAGKEK